MTDIILAVIIIGIVGAAVLYIRKQKKNGVKCIGCPAAKTCAAKAKEAGSDYASSGSCGGACSSCNGRCNSCTNAEKE